jgi:hypothetical protein
MMAQGRLEIGDIVRLTTADLAGVTGIVSRPISEVKPGPVLVYREGFVLGMEVSRAEVTPADKTSSGYAQPAYNLIKLGSYVIEQGLLQDSP